MHTILLCNKHFLQFNSLGLLFFHLCFVFPQFTVCVVKTFVSEPRFLWSMFCLPSTSPLSQGVQLQMDLLPLNHLPGGPNSKKSCGELYDLDPIGSRPCTLFCLVKRPYTWICHCIMFLMDNNVLYIKCMVCVICWEVPRPALPK